MQNSNGLNKNILILTIVLFALIAALGIMFKLGGDLASVSSLSLKGEAGVINKNISELNSFDAELDLFAGKDAVSRELDAALNEAGEINDAAASLTDLTDDEENLNNFTQELNDSFNDELTDQEIDKALQEMAL